MARHELAFLILAHADAAMLDSLLKSLPPDSHKFVHIDRKSAELDGFSPSAPGTHLIQDRLAVYWAGFSVVEATLALLREAILNTKAQRFVLLSGQSYPLKPNGAIIEFFENNPSKEFIGYFNMTTASQHYIDKLQTYFLPEELFARRFPMLSVKAQKFASRASSKLARLVPRDWRAQLGGLTPAFGSQWWAVTRACAEYMLEQSTRATHLDFFKYTFAPDEMYFHTAVANSPFHAAAGGFLPFVGRGNWRLNKLHLLNSKGSLHKLYTLEDWADIAGSDKLFTRKLSSGASMPLILRIEAELRKS